jgi:superfamily II DNA/RNA helicase
VPTRELAIQVTDDLKIAGGKLGSRVLSVYGGRAYEPQIAALKDGVDVVVGTPGRLLDLVKQKYLDLSKIDALVLDEADRMLDLGFLPDIERIVDLIPAKRQTMLFSATMPGAIVTLSRKYLTRPTNIRAESHAESETVPQVVQHVWQAHQMDKPEVLARILQANGRGLTMVFCQTKRACDRVAEDLAKRGFAAAAVHGDLGQGQRERALRAFRAGKIDVLVATDVAARGLDVDDITHVVNYECPEDDKAYVHRIGRTGRAGKEGIAVTLVDWRDIQRWKLINTALGLDFPNLEEMYSSSEALYTAMDIPAGVTGTLPRDKRERAGLNAEELEDIGETGRNRTPARRADRPGRSDRPERPARTPRPETTEQDEAPRTPRKRNRSRTRTRSGEPLTADTIQVSATAAEVPTAPESAASESAASEGAVPETEPAPKVKAAPRTRTPRARTTKATGEPAVVPQPVEVADHPVKAERPRTPRRRIRSAKPAEALKGISAENS